MSLQETPVHLAPRRLALALIALFLIALTGSIVGKVACLDEAKVTQIIEAFHDAARNNLRPGYDTSPDGTVQAYAGTLPEYVLGPQNPLSSLTPDMHCTFFQGGVRDD